MDSSPSLSAVRSCAQSGNRAIVQSALDLRRCLSRSGRPIRPRERPRAAPYDLRNLPGAAAGGRLLQRQQGTRTGSRGCARLPGRSAGQLLPRAGSVGQQQLVAAELLVQGEGGSRSQTVQARLVRERARGALRKRGDRAAALIEQQRRLPGLGKGAGARTAPNLAVPLTSSPNAPEKEQSLPEGAQRCWGLLPLPLGADCSLGPPMAAAGAAAERCCWWRPVRRARRAPSA